MNVTKQVLNGAKLIVIDENEANLSNADAFKKIVINEIEEGELRIIVSFENVEYVDSSFLGALVALLKRLLPIDGKLVLSGMNKDIINLFQMTKLDQIFMLKQSVEEALKQING